MKSIFGTDGIRKEVGQFPLNESCLLGLSKAIGTWILNNYGENIDVLIAHDTRISSSYIKSFIKSGLLSYPLNICDIGVLPTPVIINIVSKQKLFDVGIMITASHNGHKDNGIKIVTKNGKITELDETEIESIFFKKNFKEINYNRLGAEKRAQNLTNIYFEDLKNNFKPNFLNNLKIGLDCANGATEKLAPKIFKYFGAQVKAISCKSDGLNINNKCGSTQPANIQKLVIKYNLDFGVAFDGDGDRLTLVSRSGKIKDGDDILAILSNHPGYQNQTTIVGTIMSNEGLNYYFRNNNKTLTRTDVGDKHVVNNLEQNSTLLGAEPSGHIILRDFINTSDGVFAALKTIEAAIYNNNLELKSFEKMPQASKNITIIDKYSLEEEPFVSIINKYKNILKDGRIIARYSGTEPLLRISVEALNQQDAVNISTNLANELAPFLNKNIEDLKHDTKIHRKSI